MSQHLLPPNVTSERESRLLDWVVQYAINVRGMWAEKGEPVDSPAGIEALEAVVASMLCLDIPEWMPLAHALPVVRMEAVLFPESVSPDRLRNALRTVNSATQDEIDAAICDQLGIEDDQLKKFRDRHDAQEPTEAAPSSDNTALYRYFDDCDRLLYVGIAANPNMRDKQHAANSRWHFLQARRSVEWHPTREAASAAERAAIKAEEPIFNLTHATSNQRRAALDYLFDRLGEQTAS